MKDLLWNYIKMLRSGFYLKTFLFTLLLIIPSLINGLYNIHIGYYEIPFVIILDFIIMFSGINEISEKGYSFCITLPIRTQDIIKIAYVHTYTIYFLGFLGTIFVSILRHKELSTLYLLFIAVSLLGTNALYPILCSSELKIRMTNIPDVVVWELLGLVAMGLIIFLMIAITTYLHLEILTFVFISLIAAFTVKKSYIATLKRIME